MYNDKYIVIIMCNFCYIIFYVDDLITVALPSVK